MVFLKIVLKVQITLIVVCIMRVFPLNIQGKGQLPQPSLIAQAVNLFFRTYNNISAIERRTYKAKDKSLLEKVIIDKIIELQPFLQDFDNNEITDQNNSIQDDTTILDALEYNDTYLRKKDEPLNKSIQKYKKVMMKISKKLKKEPISEKTKDLIVKTIESLINRLVKNRCDWKRIFHSNLDSPPTYPVDVFFTWNKEWQDIKKAFTNSLLKYKLNLIENTNDDFDAFLDNSIKLFNYISDDIEKIPKRHKIKCNIMNPSNVEITNVLRLKKNTGGLHCRHFKICSFELQDYMNNLYEKINETAVSVIRNYAEMYTRDVNLGSNVDKESIVPALKRISDFTENNVTNIFVTETKKLKLHKLKNKDANIASLLGYTKNILKSTQDYISTVLTAELGLLNSDLVSTVNDDIRVNSEVELNNLKRDLLGRLCNTFRFCNGDYISRSKNKRYELKDNKRKPFVLMNINSFNDNPVNVTKDVFSTPSRRAIDVNITIVNVTRTTHFYSTTTTSTVTLMI